MNKNAILLVVALAWFAVIAVCTMHKHTVADVVPELPASFTITERCPTLGDHVYDITSGRQAYGTVNQDVRSIFGKKFEYLDKSGATVATAHARVISWGAQIDVVDAHGKSIGTIKEQVWTSIFGVTNKYSVLDSAGKRVAESDKFQFLGTKFTVKDNAGHVATTLERPAFNAFGHKWSVSVSDKSVIDSRLLVMIAAFKTAEDNSKH